MIKSITGKWITWLFCFLPVSLSAFTGNRPYYHIHAPAITVTGVITDAQSGDPLAGVSIMVKETSQGVTTDL